MYADLEMSLFGRENLRNSAFQRGMTFFIYSSERNSSAPCVLHCASLLGTIFASLARANERVLVQNGRNFLQARLDSEIKARFLLNEHGDLDFLLHNNSAHVILFKLQ